MTVEADPIEIALPPSGLLRALGCNEAVPVLRGRQVWVVRLAHRQEVRSLRPSIPDLLEVDPGEGMLGVALTAPSGDGADFVSRFFAPWIGVPEDSVTGVAHTALAPYWAGQLDRDRLVGRQLSAREGRVNVHVDGDRVHLSGPAVTVARGTFLLPRDVA
jgi:predicted PhzF superfamily epimerase YddE/YHI9